MAPSQKFPLVSYQPFRLMYQATRTLLMLAKMPLWMLVAIVPRLRQNPNWSFTQSILARVLKNMVDINSNIGITEAISLAPGKDGDKFTIIKPQSSEHYASDPFVSDSVKPEEVGATWYPNKPETAASLRTVVLHLHGGAFIMGDGRGATCGYLAKQYLEVLGADAVLCPQYRLSGYGGQNPFPAALQDTLTCYLHLTRELGIPGDRIIIAGDSAGGNLVVGLMRYLAQADTTVPKPLAAIMASPWVSPMSAVVLPATEFHNSPKFSSDYLPLSFLKWGALAYADGVRGAARHPYIEPLGNPFASPVPFFVNIGEVEVFEPAITAWCDEMRAVENGSGNVMEVNYEPAAPHDTALAAEICGFQDSLAEVMRKAAAFVEKNRTSRSRL